MSFLYLCLCLVVHCIKSCMKQIPEALVECLRMARNKAAGPRAQGLAFYILVLVNVNAQGIRPVASRSNSICYLIYVLLPAEASV